MSTLSPSNLRLRTDRQFVLKGSANSAAPLLNAAFRNYTGPSFAIKFWDDSVWYSEAEDFSFRLLLRTDDAWRALSSTPDEVSLGGKYVTGEIDVEGDLFMALRALPAIERSLLADLGSYAVKLSELRKRLVDQSSRALRWGAVHSKRRDSAAITYHYDKPSEFYVLFLGPSMVYSCAYFRDWRNDLNRAQRDKMDLICRKLDLKPHDRFLDIGCGWGSLVMHACEAYGVSSHGVSLSEEQVVFANRKIVERNYQTRCAVYLKDFRDLSHVRLQFDKIASVGMCEHVGLKNIDAYFREAYELLTPGGLFLNHGITRSASFSSKGPSFIDRYVFPDGELLTLSDMIHAAEDAGFEIRDVEDLREHYEETLHRWVEALSRNEREAVSITDRQTFRIWRLYMAGSAEAFRRGDIALHQLLLSKNDNGRSSATKVREDWYHNHEVGDR
jgi:cyclopropane-fatty-acyl-phospholipid synthase